MDKPGIGVQQIPPSTRTRWPRANPYPPSDEDDKRTEPGRERGRPPAEPGTGRIVDQVA